VARAEADVILRVLIANGVERQKWGRENRLGRLGGTSTGRGAYAKKKSGESTSKKHVSDADGREGIGPTPGSAVLPRPPSAVSMRRGEAAPRDGCTPATDPVRQREEGERDEEEEGRG